MIYELAGIIGIDPSPFTLRELHWMAQSKREVEIWALAGLKATIVNHSYPPPRRAAQAADFVPNKLKPRREQPKLRDVLPAIVAVQNTAVVRPPGRVMVGP